MYSNRCEENLLLMKFPANNIGSQNRHPCKRKTTDVLGLKREEIFK